MSFPKYPEYKVSNVEGLDSIPTHWSISRLGYEAWIRARLGWKGLKAEEYVDDGYIFLSTPNIKGRDIDFQNVNYISQHRFDESPEIKLRKGDVLLAKDGSTLGTVNIVHSLPHPATVNSSIAVLTPHKRLVGLYLRYLFDSEFMRNTIQSIKGGMGVPHLFQEDLSKFYLPQPSLNEQQIIAAFLDHETAKIDALIDEQKRLIELLKEKRQAVISNAVTKGLDPTVPMKDSGVEWLGEMPAHWTIDKLARNAQIGNGSTPSRDNLRYWENGHYPWMNSGALSNSLVSKASDLVSSDALQECHLPIVPAGSVLIALTGQGKTRGTSALLEVEATINQHVAYIRPAGRLTGEYLHRSLQAAYRVLRYISDGEGSTKGALTCSVLGNFGCPFRHMMSK